MSALTSVFGEAVAGVVVIEHSLYAKLHRGMRATTRPNRVLLAISGDEFAADPDLLLHEFFHVLRQWATGELTRRRYVWESARHGYCANRFEIEAREFTSRARAHFDRIKT